MDAQAAIDAGRLATAAAARIPAPPPDPIYRTLAQAEQGALRRFSPRRSWPELAEHDQKIAEADQAPRGCPPADPGAARAALGG
jgi:hypothetical protein